MCSRESISNIDLNQFAEQTRKVLSKFPSEYKIEEMGVTEIDGQNAVLTIFMHK